MGQVELFLICQGTDNLTPGPESLSGIMLFFDRAFAA
jgi:hypothetical protein